MSYYSLDTNFVTIMTNVTKHLSTTVQVN